jgi:LysM repeat protein
LNTMTNPDKLKVGQKILLPGKINLDAPKRHVVKKSKAEPAADAEGGNEYTVQPGDSLSAIAVKHGTTVAAIKKANGMTSNALRAGEKIVVPGSVKKEEKADTETEKAGDKAEPQVMEPSTSEPAAVAPTITPVTAPAPAGVAPAADGAGMQPAVPEIAPVSAPAPAAVPPVAGKGTQSYIVEPNDDLVKVSKMWGVSVDELKKINNLTDTALKPGQMLKIPIVE